MLQVCLSLCVTILLSPGIKGLNFEDCFVVNVAMNVYICEYIFAYTNENRHLSDTAQKMKLCLCV